MQDMTRRRLLELAGTAAAGTVLLPSVDALARVGSSRFMSARQLLAWQSELDKMGLRATGSAVQERYVDTLRDRLGRAGVRQLHFESVPHKRWLADSWSLNVTSGPGTGKVPTASYLPYSGGTPAGGITAPLVHVDGTPAPGSLAGKIALYELPTDTLTFGAFAAIAYKAYDPHGQLKPDVPYQRSWVSISPLIAMLDALVASGAAGVVVVLDLPADAAHGAYYPYDGNIRAVPGVYVDRANGAKLRQVAAAGGSVKLELRSETKQVKTRNLIGVIPGASDELMILHSHTDGTNAIEDNGPNAIVAMSQYLARLPRRSLPRTILVLLTTGHFAGGAGVEAFVERHKKGTLKHVAAALTLEHLGALEWLPKADGSGSKLTGQFEVGTIFTPETTPLVNASYDALKRAKAAPSSVLRPFIAAPGSPDGSGWPAEGTQLWTMGAVPTANFITGPTYLLNWGIPTMDKFDVALMRRQAIAFTEALLALSRVPKPKLHTLDLR
jgi:hypothetical protein